MSFVLASNDYDLLFRFTSEDSLNIDAEMIWLVDESAVEGTDNDVEHLTKLSEVTVQQDKTITENNQAGILSERYRPGPYSTQEARLITIRSVAKPWRYGIGEGKHRGSSWFSGRGLFTGRHQ